MIKKPEGWTKRKMNEYVWIMITACGSVFVYFPVKYWNNGNDYSNKNTYYDRESVLGVGGQF